MIILGRDREVRRGFLRFRGLRRRRNDFRRVIGSNSPVLEVVIEVIAMQRGDDAIGNSCIIETIG
ncbi:hypothetical protein WDZ92_52295, partial [Nostoc sp. NIES-2111]